MIKQPDLSNKIRNVDQWKRLNEPEKKQESYAHLIFDKEVKK